MITDHGTQTPATPINKITSGFRNLVIVFLFLDNFMY